MATEARPVEGVTIRERNVAERQGAPVLTSSARSRPVSPAAVEADTVQVWPHLVVIEFLGAIVFTILLVLLGTLANAPLEPLANPDKTPNPSKAPWYFMNLQELLLHMNSALAGVIVPTVALIALAAIPYIDKGTRGLGVWFYNERGPRIAWFSAIFTTVVLAVLIAFGELVPLRDIFLGSLKPGHMLSGVPGAFTWAFGDEATARGILVEAVTGWILPTLIMILFIVLLVILLRIMFRRLNTAELTIGLFSAFFATYVVLTFVGQFMRGHGMKLYPPWAVPPTEYGFVFQLLGLG
ncbi:MAG TPA: menaquinol-cytochrome C reductase [Chloroflexia bacterium]|nr:menaquinol-cytochrome C reductase [Chloroflexia bacterium]